MTIKIAGTLDIECAEWDRFVVGSTYDATTRETTVHHTMGALVDCVMLRGGSWWAHLGGQYDFLAVLEVLHARGIPANVALSGSRVSRIQAGGVTWCDSYSLVPMPLAQLARIAGDLKTDLDLPCRCAFACGGWCSIGDRRHRAKVAEYCANDARVLYRGLVALTEFAREHGIELRGTIGGTAWATAQATLDLPDAEFPPQVWNLVRAAYVGGRVAVVRPQAAGPGTHWDISSAYPSALARTPLPVGAPRIYGGRSASRCLDNRIPGLYSATIDIPAMLVPPLPMRAGEGLSYPWGEGISGTWALPEIEAALERGCELTNVSRAITWDPKPMVVFGELVPHWYSLRRKAGKATALGAWLRELCNSLTGKLSESPERRNVRMHPETIQVCDGKPPCSRHVCSDRCGAYRQIDTWGSIFSAPFFRPSSSSHVHWACYLTAVTRIAWLEGAESQGDDLVYGDTDSIWTTSRRGPKPQGIALGHWERKHSWRNFVAVGPKAYRYEDEFGEGTIRVAGATRVTDADWLRGSGECARGVKPLLSAAVAGNGLFKRDVKKWMLPGGLAGWEARDTYGDRALDPSSGQTYPPYHHGQTKPDTGPDEEKQGTPEQSVPPTRETPRGASRRRLRRGPGVAR